MREIIAILCVVIILFLMVVNETSKFMSRGEGMRTLAMKKPAVELRREFKEDRDEFVEKYAKRMY